MGVYLLMAVGMKNTVLSSTLRMEAGSSSKMIEHFCHTKKGLCTLGPCRPQTHYIFMFIFYHITWHHIIRTESSKCPMFVKLLRFTMKFRDCCISHC